MDIIYFLFKWKDYRCYSTYHLTFLLDNIQIVNQYLLLNCTLSVNFKNKAFLVKLFQLEPNKTMFQLSWKHLRRGLIAQKLYRRWGIIHLILNYEEIRKDLRDRRRIQDCLNENDNNGCRSQYLVTIEKCKCASCFAHYW